MMMFSMMTNEALGMNCSNNVHNREGERERERERGETEWCDQRKGVIIVSHGEMKGSMKYIKLCKSLLNIQLI